MAYILVNQTSAKDTLYYLQEPAILFILKGNKIQYTICGEQATYLYKTLATSEEKKKYLHNVPQYNKIFYANLLKQMEDVLETVASYEGKYIQ